MSNLLRSIQNPPFGWVVRWEETDELGRPLEDREAALRQPDRIKVKFDVPDGSTRAAANREVTAEITPDKGVFGAEFALQFTIPEFTKKIRARLDATDAGFVGKLFDIFGECLQGKALVKWRAVLLEKHMPVEDRTVDSFKEAQADYLESVEKIKKLGNVLIRQQRNLKRPAWMEYDEYDAVKNKWDGYLDEGYVRFTIARATAQEKCEEVFFQQPKAHQGKYAEKHEDVEDDQDKLRVFFNGCMTADKNDGTFAKIMKSQDDAIRARAAKAAKERSSNRPSGRNGSPRGFRRGDRSYRPDQRSGGRFYRSSGRGSYRSGSGSYRSGGHGRDRGRDGRSGGSYRREGYSGRNDREKNGSGRDERDRNSNGRGGQGHNDRGRDRGRDDRGRYQGGRRDGRQGHTSYHVDDDGGRSRSPSRERSRSPSRDRSIDGFHASVARHDDDVAMEEASYQRSLKREDAGARRSKPAKRAKGEGDFRWVREMARGKPSKDRDGVPVGFGSFYKRIPGMYSREELNAKQGHEDRVRTADLIPEHKLAREMNGDDSELESDWRDRTAIDPEEHRAQRETEERLAARRELDGHGPGKM